MTTRLSRSGSPLMDSCDPSRALGHLDIMMLTMRGQALALTYMEENGLCRRKETDMSIR